MAIKKSEIYNSLWTSCDKLRGSMEPSQYKNYILVLLFVKYVTDKYYGKSDAIIRVPEGGSFKDLQASKGKKDIGEKIDTAISILADKNDLRGVIDVVSFQDEELLGKGKSQVDRLTDLIAIFEKPELDFSRNRADGDDILGDAYEYLMRNFASQSGKSKGEFYTPSEVSRVIAKVIGVRKSAFPKQTIYDPTCGSGSLLLKVAEEAGVPVNLYGQEMTVSTAALAQMNMILHGNEDALIAKGQSTLAHPFFPDSNGGLKTFDFVVANPPFSSKNWTDGFDPNNDFYGRYVQGLVPPEKNGDYAFLLHIIKSLKSTGKGACILPHGVLFRGNVEGEIRKDLVRRGYIKGIIGLPANLFYGTGIPACILVLDMEHAQKVKDLRDDKKGIFIIDASKGFIKDGNKNRLREQDIHKIVDTFNRQIEIPKYSRFIPLSEISDPKNNYNLNITRYIDSQEPDDIQDIEAHLLGGIPSVDINKLNEYWEIFPSLKKKLFTSCLRPNYKILKVPNETIQKTIVQHQEFINYYRDLDSIFRKWSKKTVKLLKEMDKKVNPKEVIFAISEDLLKTFSGRKLVDTYDIYQHLMSFWAETMQDDCFIISIDGWKAEPYRITTTSKSGRENDKGWECDLVPKTIVINRYFRDEKETVEALESKKDSIIARLTELEEENSGEEGIFEEFEKSNRASIQKKLCEIISARNDGANPKLHLKNSNEPSFDFTTDNKETGSLEEYLQLTVELIEINKTFREKANELDLKALSKYQELKSEDIKYLVVIDKWMKTIEGNFKIEIERISERLAHRIKELAERYETPLHDLMIEVAKYEKKVKAHLNHMGFKCN